jgi:S1-C subfamily serine protease
VIVHEDDTHYYAITNEHIIDGNDYVINSHEVITNDEVSSTFEIIAQSEDIDLAIIKFTKIDREVIQPLSIQENSISINDLIVSVGNPTGNIATITYGYIESITELQELELTHLVYEHNATLFNGSSGGALVDLNGNIIGINTWTLNGSFFAIRGSVINNFLLNNL